MITRHYHIYYTWKGSSKAVRSTSTRRQPYSGFDSQMGVPTFFRGQIYVRDTEVNVKRFIAKERLK